MKLTALFTILALALTWVAPAAAAYSTPPSLPHGDGLPRGETVSPDVIGIITVLTAYAVLWGAFAVALKIRAMLDDDADGSSSEASSGTLTG